MCTLRYLNDNIARFSTKKLNAHLSRVSWVFILPKNVGSQTSPLSRQAKIHDCPCCPMTTLNSLTGGQFVGLQKS